MYWFMIYEYKEQEKWNGEIARIEVDEHKSESWTVLRLREAAKR